LNSRCVFFLQQEHFILLLLCLRFEFKIRFGWVAVTEVIARSRTSVKLSGLGACQMAEGFLAIDAPHLTETLNGLGKRAANTTNGIHGKIRGCIVKRIPFSFL
jgi:hypothetical protein